MVSSRLKDLIFKKLYKDLSHVEIIHFHDYIWFIDREEKFWYFRYCKSDGRLLWRYGFFTKFFVLFTMDESEFTPVISSWVEEVLNYRVNTTMSLDLNSWNMVEDVLNCKVDTTRNSNAVAEIQVDTTWLNKFGFNDEVEEVLNYKVDTTSGKSRTYVSWWKRF